MNPKGQTSIMTVLLVVVVLSVMGGLGYLGYQKWVGPEGERTEEVEEPQEEEAPALKTATAVIDKIKESYSGLENFVVTVENYRGKPGQSREEMTFLHRLKFYFRVDGGESYTEVMGTGQSAAVNTYEPLRIIGEIDQYEGIVLKGEKKLDGHNTYLLKWKGKGNTGPSPEWKMWIDAEKYTVLRQEMYSDSVLGMKSQYEYKKVNDYWLPSKIENEMHVPGEEPDRMLLNIRRNYKINQEFPGQILDKLR